MLGTYHRLNVTIHDDWRAVIRAARGRIAKKARRDPARRADRKRFYRLMLRHHRDAQELAAAWRL